MKMSFKRMAFLRIDVQWFNVAFRKGRTWQCKATNVELGKLFSWIGLLLITPTTNGILKMYVGEWIMNLCYSCLFIQEHFFLSWWRTPNLLYRFKCESKVKIMEEQRVGARSLACSISGVEGRTGAPGWGLGRVTSIN